MSLKSLEEHNAEKIAALRRSKGNGIACPGCGQELIDTDDGFYLVHPPKIKIVCLNCAFTGYKR